ncbi:two-component regulator propeller domain-containing protein [Emticicia sp. BO119]|uniref:type IX secretion system anionic LPS delivery protein PorZ n=1 Tax=Emticicia sp. BO119 TaxID=2757768 RepID=UPI0015F000F9|nr:two-component regulator propeller domain-containing protein [Emticicia sp. BO119]MBA4850990.1 T9SS type A sorting domain-containing protein [Emticicia sp. BO119]
MLRILLCFFTFQAFAQIPTNTWQTHNNYVNLKGLEIIEKKIYTFSENGFFYFDKTNKQAIKLSKADGLSEANLAQIRYSPDLRKLLIAYETGNLDLTEIDSDGSIGDIQNINFIKNTNTIQINKRINAIEFQGDFAYLASDFGLVVLDTKKAEIKETYQNIGSGGKTVSLKQIAFARDSIFINTPDGILGAKFAADVNLQFFGNWKSVIDIELFKPKQYPQDPLINTPHEIETDKEGKAWIADETNGLISNWEGSFKSYSPNGPKGQISELFYLESKIYTIGSTGNIFSNNEWQNISLNQIPAYSKDVIDEYGFRWQIVSNGVRVTDDATRQTRLYTIGKNTGNLPSTIVNAIAIDKEGTIWIGTNDGIAAVIPARDIFIRAVDAYTPFNNQGRRILLQETVKKIVIDGGNRKWIGTNNGLNLFVPAVDELIQNFTETNSPLPTNEITDLSIDTASGELFVLTPKGLLSYQSDASEPKEDFSGVKIFPNPIRPGYQGVMTISGLRDNSAIKITDAAGRLIYETKSNGGTASWNLNDSTESRTISGIYMVFCIAQDGSESLVGKVAVVK